MYKIEKKNTLLSCGTFFLYKASKQALSSEGKRLPLHHQKRQMRVADPTADPPRELWLP